MAELARGSVFDRPWGKTLAAIGMRGVTGQVTITEGDKSYAIAFADGAVVGARSPLASDSAVRLALTATLINSTQAGEITRRLAANPASDEIAVICEVGNLGPEHAIKLRRRTIAQQTARTFALERGTFVLTDEVSIACWREASIDIRAIIYMAARTALTEARLENDFEQFPFSMKLSADAIPVLAQYGFTESERGVLELLNLDTHTLAELESAHTRVEPRTLRAIIYALACTGAFEPSTVGRPTSRSVKSAPGTAAKISYVPTEPIVERRSQRNSASIAAAVPTKPVTESSTNVLNRSTIVPQSPTSAAGRSGSNPLPNQGQAHRGAAQGTSPPSTIPPAPAAQNALASVRGTGVAAVVTAGAVTSGAAGGERNPALIAGITALIKERLHILDRGADHFVLLGVNEQTPPDQIRTAYFALARQLHPDRLTSAGIVELKRDAQRLFAQINTAFAVLTNPEKRLQYVQVLRQGGEAVVRAKQAEAEALTARVLAAEDAFHRGEMALRRSQFDAAVADFTEAITANPDEGDYHASLAWAMFCGANDKSSVEKNTRIVFEKSVKLSPRSVTALLYWGRMERMLGNTSAAREKFEAILQKEPSHSEASSELRVLDARGDRSDERDKGDKGDKGDKPKGGLFGLFKK